MKIIFNGIKEWLRCFLIVMFSGLYASCEELYILTDLLDMDQIRSEEMLSDDVQIVRIYIFLAVWNGKEYDTYTTNGKSDLDSDGTEAVNEPNDLNEYHNDTVPIVLNSTIVIEEEDYICYIANLPNFDEIFPDEEDPLENSSLIDVQTSAHPENGTRLAGSKSVPVVTDEGEQEGVERFIAFYNKRGEPKVEGEGSKNDVLSFGFIEMKMLQDFSE